MRTLSVDPKRHVIIPGDYQETLDYAIKDWLATAKKAILAHGYFAVALSGGSTPKAIFEGLAKQPEAIDWSKVLIFWSDERACAKTDADSNYKMAIDALKSLPIDPQHIFPMEGVGDLEENARRYEDLIEKNIPSKKFDLMMLGMGDDGHTASLFPKTHGLHAPGRSVIANFIPDKGIWRLSVTFDCINASEKKVIYVLGAGKAEMIQRVFSKPVEGDLFPIQNVGKDTSPAFYILDKAAARLAFNGAE